jgi:hypothetical protein
VNDRHVTIKALEMALKRRCSEVGLLHHSDQGCTYASEDYQLRLAARGIVCSMSRRGNCWDKAVMESCFSTVMSELGEHFESHGDAKMELFDYIEVFYNQRRRHSTLGQISPAAFERRALEEGVDAWKTAQNAVSHRARTRRLPQEHKNVRRRAINSAKPSTESDRPTFRPVQFQAGPQT